MVSHTRSALIEKLELLPKDSRNLLMEFLDYLVSKVKKDDQLSDIQKSLADIKRGKLSVSKTNKDLSKHFKKIGI